ncbi:MAG: efflux RND transporter periplasmic adaptor subunit [Spirochaetales bacterium]|nr:efflux RND transporter periplasmic adaptor subunit [Spirochaetales bacterium]
MKRVLKYIVALLLIAVAFMAVAWFYSTREVDTYTSPTTPVEVILPESRVIKESYTVTGYIEAEAMVPVVPFVSGTILEYYAENDMNVKKDQVLAVIDPEPYELQLKQAEAAYLAYEATFERVYNLYEKGAATKQNYDEVKAQRDAGKAQYDLAQLQLSYCYVDSPVDGTILMSNGAVGSIGTSESPIAVIADLDNLIVNLKVPEKYYLDISSNNETLKVNVTRKVNGKEYATTATLISVSPYIDPTTKTFSVKVKLDGDVSLFRPGMMVDVEIIYREEEVLSLPQSVKKLDGSLYIVAEDYNGGYKAKYLELETLLGDDDYFQVDDKYKDTMFIYRGQSKVLDGQPVTITEGY